MVINLIVRGPSIGTLLPPAFEKKKKKKESPKKFEKKREEFYFRPLKYHAHVLRRTPQVQKLSI
jgi:hypothetical protein